MEITLNESNMSLCSEPNTELITESIAGKTKYFTDKSLAMIEDNSKGSSQESNGHKSEEMISSQPSLPQNDVKCLDGNTDRNKNDKPIDKIKENKIMINVTNFVNGLNKNLNLTKRHQTFETTTTALNMSINVQKNETKTTNKSGPETIGQTDSIQLCSQETNATNSIAFTKCSQNDIRSDRMSLNLPTIGMNISCSGNRFDRNVIPRAERIQQTIQKAFGLDMTEMLKKKRDEFEAKRRQTIANAFTPCAVNTSEIENRRDLSCANLSKTVTELSTDLFSKTNLEIEANMSVDIDVEESSVSDEEEDCDSESVLDQTNNKSKRESISQTKSESTSETKSFSISETKSESTSDSESNSGSKSQSSSESKSKSDSNSESTSRSSSVTKSDSLSMTSQSGKLFETIKTISDLQSRETSISSDTTNSSTSLDLNSTSPLSISVVHSSDSRLVSSPTIADPTLNFTFHASDDSETFNPFIHTNQSFSRGP